ncbi:hypothetical protein [Virgibacillus sp. JSM 102003]
MNEKQWEELIKFENTKRKLIATLVVGVYLIVIFLLFFGVIMLAEI